MLNPNMRPGSLASEYVTPFTDVQVNIAKEWAWHGNWIRHDYAERYTSGVTVPRNVHGDTLTLSVRYAF
jgi:hypothetical protein